MVLALPHGPFAERHAVARILVVWSQRWHNVECGVVRRSPRLPAQVFVLNLPVEATLIPRSVRVQLTFRH
jgi:hypothetical protein